MLSILLSTSFVELILEDKILYFLIFIILLLFILALVLAVYTLILRRANRLKALKWMRLENKWQPVVLDVLSGTAKSKDLLDLVGDEERLYFVDFLERFAQRLRGEERGTLSELALPFLDPVVRNLQHKDAERRARAVQTLCLLGLPHYANEIIVTLDDPAPLVSMVAARYLMRREHPEYALHVLDHLHNFGTWSRNLLASMMASVGPKAIPALRDTFVNKDKPIFVRCVAADALRQLNDFKVADAAVHILGSETDRELLAASLRLLTTIGNPDHVPAVVRQLCDSSDFVVRANALKVLGYLARLPQDISILKAAIDDSSSWVAIQAAQGLKESGSLDILRDIAMSDHPRANLAQQVLTEAMQ